MNTWSKVSKNIKKNLYIFWKINIKVFEVVETPTYDKVKDKRPN